MVDVQQADAQEYSLDRDCATCPVTSTATLRSCRQRLDLSALMNRIALAQQDRARLSRAGLMEAGVSDLPETLMCRNPSKDGCLR